MKTVSRTKTVGNLESMSSERRDTIVSLIKIVAALLLFILVLGLVALRARYGTQENNIAGDGAGEQITSSWVTNRNLLSAYEREQSRLRLVVVKQRKLYRDGAISKSEVAESERSFVAVLARIQDVRRLMAEAEIAIAEAEFRNRSSEEAMASLGSEGETVAPPRYGSDRAWSLKRAQEIENYFYQNFGHSLPVSAFGQTATHTHMRFDHREAMDVALHPDSREGRALIGYLHRSGIPFIVFRGAVAGAATGAHIHIGKPSRRMAANVGYLQ